MAIAQQAAHFKNSTAGVLDAGTAGRKLNFASGWLVCAMFAREAIEKCGCAAKSNGEEVGNGILDIPLLIFGV